MKLTISDGSTVLLNLDDLQAILPDNDRDRAVAMKLLSEALVLVANDCEAHGVESDASDISDAIRKDMLARLRSQLPEGETQH